MNTKYEKPMLAKIFFVCAVIFYIAAALAFLAGIRVSLYPYAKMPNGGIGVLASALGFGIVGLTYHALSSATHFVLDSLARSADANEQMLALMLAQNSTVPGRNVAAPPSVGLSSKATHRVNAPSITTSAPAPARTPAASSDPRVTCIHCSTRIAFPPEGAGQELPCPTCGKPLLLVAS